MQGLIGVYVKALELRMRDDTKDSKVKIENVKIDWGLCKGFGVKKER